MTRLALLPLLLLQLAAPAAVDLEVHDATLSEAVAALSAGGVPAVCVVDDGRRATARFAGLPPDRAAAFVASAFAVPLRRAGDLYALGGGATGAVLLLVETPGGRKVGLARAGDTLEVALPGGGACRVTPLLFGEGGSR